jgi:hypothetical protein
VIRSRLQAVSFEPELEADGATRSARPKDRDQMTNSTVMIADMGILVGIFLLGLLAKLFPKNRHKAKQ